jgi:hypothetical protein
LPSARSPPAHSPQTPPRRTVTRGIWRLSASAQSAAPPKPSPLHATRRTAIRRFNESVGGENSDTAGYHETLTRLWCVVVARALAAANPAPATDFDAACIAVQSLGHRRDLFREYYSWDIVADREARRAWTAPDRIGSFGPIDG